MSMKKEVLDIVTKSFSEAPGSTGNSLIAYNLENTISVLYPDTTRFAKDITRVFGGYGRSAEFDVVTKNASDEQRGMTERGKTGSVNRLLKKRYSQTYHSFGRSGTVVLQDELDHGPLTPERKALEVNGMMHSHARNMERLIIGGNSSSSLVKPVVTGTVSSGGTITAGSYDVQVVSLNYQAYVETRYKSITDITVPATKTMTDVYGNVTETNFGHSLPSDAVSVTTTTTNKTINATWPIDPNAFGYLVFAGATGSVKLQALVFVNAITLTSLVTNTVNVSTVDTTEDRSVEIGAIDGVLTQVLKANSGATVNYLTAGATLSKGSRNNCVEIDALLTDMWQKKMIEPSKMYMSPKVFTQLADTMGDSLVRFNVNGNGDGKVVLGSTVNMYIHPATGHYIEIISALEFPDVILFVQPNTTYGQGGDTVTYELDYRVAPRVNFWPIMEYEQKFSILEDLCVKVKYPGAFGLIGNIKTN